MTPDDCQKKAADLSFDLTKQLLTPAFAGMAFSVGVSFNNPGTLSDFMLWATVGAFGLSVVFGPVFLIRGVQDFGGFSGSHFSGSGSEHASAQGARRGGCRDKTGRTAKHHLSRRLREERKSRNRCREGPDRIREMSDT